MLLLTTDIYNGLYQFHHSKIHVLERKCVFQSASKGRDPRVNNINDQKWSDVRHSFGLYHVLLQES